MRVILYKNGESTHRLKTIFVELGHTVLTEAGTSYGLIREIKLQKPFAIIVPHEIQDADALTFIKRAKRELSGDKPLFFVTDVDNNLNYCHILRNAGYDNVFYKTLPIDSVAESVLEYISVMESDLSENILHFSDGIIRKHITKFLKRSHFNPNCLGFTYMREAIYIIVKSNSESVDNVVQTVADKFEVSKRKTYQDMRYALRKAWQDSQKRFKRTLLSDFAEAPKPHEALFYISNSVAEEILKAENEIFDHFSRGNID